MLDPKSATVKELGDLYRRRWEAELNLRSLKSSMGMDQLRCKTPAMVRKEFWTYLLSYNLIRGVQAESASVRGVCVHQLSFVGTVQTVLAFTSRLSLKEGESYDRSLKCLWQAVGRHRVGNRPNRVEPRAVKRRKKSHPTLNKPRKLLQDQYLGKK